MTFYLTVVIPILTVFALNRRPSRPSILLTWALVHPWWRSQFFDPIKPKSIKNCTNSLNSPSKTKTFPFETFVFVYVFGSQLFAIHRCLWKIDAHRPQMSNVLGRTQKIFLQLKCIIHTLKRDYKAVMKVK